MTDTLTLTLSRAGHTATVRVGDVVPMTDGTERAVSDVREGADGVWIKRIATSDEYFYQLDGTYAATWAKQPDIDIEKTAALTRPTAPGDGLAGVVVTGEMRREITEAWQLVRPALYGVHNVSGSKLTDIMERALRAANLLPLPAPKEPTT
jgi:hypothetical protein